MSYRLETRRGVRQAATLGQLAPGSILLQRLGLKSSSTATTSTAPTVLPAVPRLFSGSRIAKVITGAASPTGAATSTPPAVTLVDRFRRRIAPAPAIQVQPSIPDAAPSAFTMPAPMPAASYPVASSAPASSDEGQPAPDLTPARTLLEGGPWLMVGIGALLLFALAKGVSRR